MIVDKQNAGSLINKTHHNRFTKLVKQHVKITLTQQVTKQRSPETIYNLWNSKEDRHLYFRF